jgi:hypothetical protein
MITQIVETKAIPSNRRYFRADMINRSSYFVKHNYLNMKENATL